MKLSEFDLTWYGQWPIAHTALEEWSRPGLTNGLGSIQISGDPTSLRHPLFPPVSGSGEYTVFLTVNGTFLPATLTRTEVAWTPWAVERRATLGPWRIFSRVTMPPGQQGVLMRVELQNTSDTRAELRVGLRLSGRCVNRGIEKWYWGVPGVSTSLADLLEHSGLDPVIEGLPDGKLFRERPPENLENQPNIGRAFNAQVLSPAPHGWARNGDAEYVFAPGPGETVVVHFALAMDETRKALDVARGMLEAPDAVFAAAESDWRKLWKSAFSDGGPLTGCLPDLDLPEELLPVGASAVLSMLQARRSHRVMDGRVCYNISTPRRVEACFYPNDWGMAARSLAQMDPAPTLAQLEMALVADIRKFNQINFLTGKGGDAIHAGWPYTVDIYNVFYATWWLWQAGGADPEALLERELQTAQGSMTLLGVFEDLALDWRSRRVESLGLADYGTKEELLECVSSYEHVVAGLNAGAVWMLRRLGEAYRALNRLADAQSVDAEADALLANILRHLYVKGCGWFRCINPQGGAREVRHCWDTGMVLMCIGPELPGDVQREIVDFFKAELQTPTWIRALSPHDTDAAVSGDRADHQFNGAFGSWPAEVALGLVRIGESNLAREWLKGIARTARQGPFGQAYFDEGVWPAVHGGSAKVSDETPQCCHWSNISGGLFFSVLEELIATQATKTAGAGRALTNV